MSVETEQTDREARDAALIAAMRSRTPDDTLSSFDMDVINDPERGRWIATLGAEAIGELSYRFVGGRVVLLTTWVDHAYRDHRVATELIGRVLDEIRQTGRTITIICPVVGEFIGRHREHLQLIDPVHPGSGAYPASPMDDVDQELRAFEADMAPTGAQHDGEAG
jgi:predicted GNAT family acetyltransferase